MRPFIDTNILLYYFASHPDEHRKRVIAEEILNSDSCVLSVQVLQEFYVQATRKSRADRLSPEDARQVVKALLRFPVQSQTVDVLQRALDISDRYLFSYWDSAIIAAAASMGCDILYTEDLQHDQSIEGVTIVNPFL